MCRWTSEMTCKIPVIAATVERDETKILCFDSNWNNQNMNSLSDALFTHAHLLSEICMHLLGSLYEYQ